MEIEQVRVQKLEQELLRVTAPSKEPDEQFRPSYWSDRMYYLLRRTNLKEIHFGRLDWGKAPSYLAFDVVRLCANGREWFESLETVVAQASRERFGA